jgi:membrane protease subunit (stomatin/prohibitin family)
MGLLGQRMGTRMGARQQYRTFARMQRRRSFIQDRMGARQDFQPAGEEEQQQQEQAPQQQAPAAPQEPEYMAELEKLSQLRDQGVITADDYDAKKKQLLGI